MKRVFDSNLDLMIDLSDGGDTLATSARSLLDPAVNNAETAVLRLLAQKIGIMPDEKTIVNEDGVVLAGRIDYPSKGGGNYYFAFCHGYDVTGWPIIEPTIDDIDEALQEEIYRVRWEMVNNRSVISLSYMGGMDVESILLILPDNYQSSFADNHELRRVAIDEGAFRPFPI